MKTRPLVLLTLVVALAAALAPAAASAAPAKGKITIDTWSKGLFGFVEGAKPNSCSAGRTVAVYKQVGLTQSPSADRKIGTSRAASTSSGGYQWSLRRAGNGTFYARAEAVPGCAALKSATVSRGGSGLVGDSEEGENANTLCGPWSGPGWCRLAGNKPLQLETEHCTDFRKGSGDCDEGQPKGEANYPFAAAGDNDLRGELQWHQEGDLRKVLYFTHTGHDNVGISHISGTLPNAGSDRFTVTDAYAQRSKVYGDGPHFETPVIAGVPRGEQGGPLGFNFESSSKILFGTEDIYIWGGLYRR
jgi:hypothetical protein